MQPSPDIYPDLLAIVHMFRILHPTPHSPHPTPQPSASEISEVKAAVTGLKSALEEIRTNSDPSRVSVGDMRESGVKEVGYGMRRGRGREEGDRAS